MSSLAAPALISWSPPAIAPSITVRSCFGSVGQAEGFAFHEPCSATFETPYTLELLFFRDYWETFTSRSPAAGLGWVAKNGGALRQTAVDRVMDRPNSTIVVGTRKAVSVMVSDVSGIEVGGQADNADGIQEVLHYVGVCAVSTRPSLENRIAAKVNLRGLRCSDPPCTAFPGRCC